MKLTAVGTLSIALCREGEEQDVKRRSVRGLRESVGHTYDQLISVRSVDGTRGVEEEKPDGEEEMRNSSATHVVSIHDEDSSPSVASPKHHHPRLIAPSKPLVGFSGKPLIDSPCVQALYYHPAWDWICGLLVGLGLILPILGSDAALGDNETETGNTLFCCLVAPSATSIFFAVGVQVSQYDRGVVKELIQCFEFWFCMMELASAVACSAYNTYYSRVGSILYVIISGYLSAATLFAGLAVMSLDASRASRRTKGIFMTIITTGCWMWAWIWGTDDTEVGRMLLQWHPFKPDFRTFISTSLIAVGMFTTKYALVSFFFKRDMLLVSFSARNIPLGGVEVERATVKAQGALLEGQIQGELSPPLPAADHHDDGDKEAPLLYTQDTSSPAREEDPVVEVDSHDASEERIGRFWYPETWTAPKDFTLYAASQNEDASHSKL